MDSPSSSAKAAPGAHPGALAWGGLFGLVLLLAVLVRLPFVLHPGALPLDEYCTGHMLLARTLAWGRWPVAFDALTWPDAYPMSPLAWPSLLLGAAAEPLLGMPAAYHFAVVLTLAAQGCGALLLGRRLGWSGGALAVAVVAVEAGPLCVTFLANSQIEQLGFLPLCLLAWVAVRPAGGGWGTGLAVGALLLLAGFGSPYVACVCALFAAVFLLRRVPAFRSLRAAIPVALAGLAAFLVIALAYRSALSDEFRPFNGPRRAVTEWEQASALALVWPDTAPMGAPDRVRTGRERWEPLWTAPPAIFPDARWPVLLQWRITYLGLPLALLGLTGLWRHRKAPQDQAVAISGGLCLLVAMAPHAGWVDRTLAAQPDLSLGGFEALFFMRSTGRFLLGTAFALAWGAARLATTWPTGRAVAAALLILADALLLAPGRWPGEIARVDLGGAERGLAEGPVAIWPPFTRDIDNHYAHLALALDRPLAIFEPLRAGDAQDQPGDGAVSARRWLARVQVAGARSLLEVPTWRTDFAPRLVEVLRQPGAGSCAAEACAWDLAAGPDGEVVARRVLPGAP